MSREILNEIDCAPRAPSFLSGTGPDGAFDSKWIYPALRPVRMGDDLWIYYFGTNHDRAGRVDRLAAKEEAAGGGVRWPHGCESAPAGKDARLRMRLRSARLYAFQFAIGRQ